MERKVCSKCKEEKEVCEFQKNSHSKSGFRSECSECSKHFKKKIPKERIQEYTKKYREKNKEKILEKQKQYYFLNITKEQFRSKKYREKNNLNKSIKPVLSKEDKKEKRKEYLLKNREIFKERRRNKYNNDILYKLSQNVRNRLNTYIKTKNIRKTNKTFDLVGCNPKQLKEHIESQFNDGMSWENRQEWHIDHKIPLSSAKTEEELYKLCHYINLQPLWVEDNLKKSNKLI
jgi:hypothetical protein